MTRSLKTPPTKKSACDPETYECLYELQNDPCDYYQKYLIRSLLTVNV
jgi:hypothetical protein